MSDATHSATDASRRDTVPANSASRAGADPEQQGEAAAALGHEREVGAEAGLDLLAGAGRWPWPRGCGPRAWRPRRRAAPGTAPASTRSAGTAPAWSRRPPRPRRSWTWRGSPGRRRPRGRRRGAGGGGRRRGGGSAWRTHHLPTRPRVGRRYRRVTMPAAGRVRRRARGNHCPWPQDRRAPPAPPRGRRSRSGRCRRVAPAWGCWPPVPAVGAWATARRSPTTPATPSSPAHRPASRSSRSAARAAKPSTIAGASTAEPTTRLATTADTSPLGRSQGQRHPEQHQGQAQAGRSRPAGRCWPGAPPAAAAPGRGRPSSPRRVWARNRRTRVISCPNAGAVSGR